MEQFLSVLPNLTTCQEILAALTAAGQEHGMDSVSVGEVAVRNASCIRRFFFTSWPDEWLKIYVDAGVVVDDPILLVARTAFLPFTWTDIRERVLQWQSGLDLAGLDLARDFGWHDGLTVPIHGPQNYLAVVSFAGGAPSLGPRSVAELTFVAHQAHARMRTLFLASAEPESDVGPVGISPREIEVLRLLAAGHTDKEIALHFHVAERTALHYVQSARAKLGCRTRAHLIAEALSSELI